MDPEAVTGVWLPLPPEKISKIKSFLGNTGADPPQYSLKLKIKRNDWLLVDTCPQEPIIALYFENHKATQPVFNVGPASVLQQYDIQMGEASPKYKYRFTGGADDGPLLIIYWVLLGKLERAPIKNQIRRPLP